MDWSKEMQRAGKWLSIAGLAAALASPASGSATDAWERGIEAYEQTRYEEAMAQFRRAAEAGNTRAQEILGFMHLQGPGLYGPAVPHNREQAVYWFSRAAQGGREVSQHMLCTLNGVPNDTVIRRAGCASASQASGRQPHRFPTSAAR